MAKTKTSSNSTTSKTYDQIQQQIAQLQAEAEKLRQQEIEGVVARIREAIEHYQLTPADLGFKAAGAAAKPARKAKGKRKAAARPAAVVAYRDEAGHTWAGRGKRPQWLRDALAAGRTLDDFRVKPG